MLSRRELAYLCDDRAKLISPYKFQESTSPAKTTAAAAADLRGSRRRNSRTPAETSENAMSNTFTSVDVNPNAR
jgi:hypothetical protein